MMLATQAFAKTPEYYANILNQSGKQRMLTERSAHLKKLMNQFQV